MAQTMETTVEPPKVVVHASFLIDASGSMSEPAEQDGSSRMDVVLQYVKKLARDMLCPKDRITLSFFNTKYKQVGIPQ